jgi:hypothetical protein
VDVIVVIVVVVVVAVAVLVIGASVRVVVTVEVGVMVLDYCVSLIAQITSSHTWEGRVVRGRGCCHAQGDYSSDFVCRSRR